MKGLGKMKINKGIVLGGLSLTVSVLNHIYNKKKLQEVNKKLSLIPELRENLMEIYDKHNKFVEFQGKNMAEFNLEFDEIRDDIGSIYEHLAYLDEDRDVLRVRCEE